MEKSKISMIAYGNIRCKEENLRNLGQSILKNCLINENILKMTRESSVEIITMDDVFFYHV